MTHSIDNLHSHGRNLLCLPMIWYVNIIYPPLYSRVWTKAVYSHLLRVAKHDISKILLIYDYNRNNLVRLKRRDEGDGNNNMGETDILFVCGWLSYHLKEYSYKGVLHIVWNNKHNSSFYRQHVVESKKSHRQGYQKAGPTIKYIRLQRTFPGI